ncbi:MAG: transposase domain-containing protein [Nannocystaceae bacterium]
MEHSLSACSRNRAWGGKTTLHCGSVDGVKRLAAAYTLVLSCKGLGLNVNDNLVDVINKLAAGWPLSRIRELVPDACAAARADASTAHPAGQ